MSTSPIITFGTYNSLGMKQDCSLSCSATLQAFSTLNDLKMHNLAFEYPYATFEQDAWLLDGNFMIKPVSNTGLHVGLMTTVISNSLGVFDSPPVLTITFGSVYSTDGITLYFDAAAGNYANSITVTFKDNAGATIRTDNYAPSSVVFQTNQAVSNFKSIVITFNSTNWPYRYLRLLDIDFSNVVYFEDKNIRDAVLVEQISPASIEIPLNTLDFHLYSTDAGFSIVNPGAIYILLHNGQPMYCYEKVDDTLMLMGNFFLDSWKNLSENEVEIHAVDLIGVLDKIVFYSEWMPGTLLNISTWTTKRVPNPGIDTVYTIPNVIIDAALSSVNLTGVLDVQSIRSGLQRKALAVGGYITCARSNAVQLKALRLAKDILTPDFHLDISTKGMEQSLTLKSIVTGVSTIIHYILSGSNPLVEIYRAFLTAGTYHLVFDKPMNTVQYFTNVSNPSSTNYRVDFTANTDNYYYLLASIYDGRNSINITEVSADPDPNIPTNLIKLEDIYLVSDQGPINIIPQRIFDYLQQRYIQKVKVYVPTFKVGDSVLVDTYSGKQLIGIVEKMTSDLSGGFVSTVEIVGIIK